MGGFVILNPGPSSFAVATDGSLLKLDANLMIYRDGRQMRGGATNTAYGGHKLGVYGKNLFVTAGDNTLWLVTPNTDTGFTHMVGSSLADLDQDFVAQMDLSFVNEPT